MRYTSSVIDDIEKSGKHVFRVESTIVERPELEKLHGDERWQ